MEQYKKIVLEAPEGMHYVTSQGEKGELIVRLFSNSLVISEKSATSSESNDEKFKYFTQITAEEREKVKKWLDEQSAQTNSEKEFVEIVKKAVRKVNYDYWIATLEPSVYEGKIYYAEGEKVGVGFSSNEWKQMAKEYAPERKSRLGNLEELFIWYALRIANGLWSLKYVAENSSSTGNYSNAPGAFKSREKTAARVCGGYKDGQGNTYKIVTVKDGVVLVGGNYNCNGNEYPVGYVICNLNLYFTPYDGSGVVVLTE